MKHVIYLTAAEKSVFESLSEELRDGWSVEDEQLEKYETVRQISMRYHLADFKFHPEVETLIKRILDGESPDIVDVEKLDPEVMKEVFFLIGARGVKSIIDTLMKNISNDDDIELLMTLSTVRHKLLEINQSSTHV